MSAEYPNRAVYVVDWDGTCVEEVWPGMGDWLPGAVDALRELSKRGKTVIWSLRCHLYEMDDRTARPRGEAGKEAVRIREMLTAAGLTDIEVYPPSRGKPPGRFYIDDRAVRYDGDWGAVLDEIDRREYEGASDPPLIHEGPFEYRYDFARSWGLTGLDPRCASHRRPVGSHGEWEELRDNWPKTIKPEGDAMEGLKTKQVVEQASGVMRDTDEGKLQPILCYDGPMFERWARHLTRGISARGKRNWMLAHTEEDRDRFRESYCRHSMQYLRGDRDEDHAAAMFFNLNGAEYVEAILHGEQWALDLLAEARRIHGVSLTSVPSEAA